MKISRTKCYAVLTGDIVGSSKLDKAERQRLPAALKSASRDTRKAFPAAVPLEIDVFRGDSWQLLVTDFVLSVRVALYLRACIRSEAERGKGLDTRMALALGAVDFVPKNNVSEGDGEAYRASGGALEALSGGRMLTLVPGPVAVPAGFDVTLRLLDALVQDWTGKQAQAVAGALRGWTQEKIVENWPAEKITQPAVTKHLAKAHWATVDAALLHIEDTLRKGAP